MRLPATTFCIFFMLIPDIMAQPTVPPPPLETVGLPDCATAHLYTIGNLHYYSTIDCANPFNTGYGTSGEFLGTFGCNGAICVEGATVNPAIIKLLAANSDAESTAQILAQLMGKQCGCGKSGRFAISKGLRGEVEVVRKRVERVTLDATDPRNAVAVDVLSDMGGTPRLVVAAQMLVTGNDLEKRQARFYLDRVSRYLNSARVQVASNPGVVLRMDDNDLQIGFLENHDDSGNVRPLNNDTSGIPPLFVGAAGWAASDAACFRRPDPQTRTYVEYRRGALRAYFRLQTVTNGSVTHNVGQQVTLDEIPTPHSQTIVDGNQNVDIIQTLEHVHVLRVRTDLSGNQLNDTNSTDFLVYSAELLGGKL